jgi:hypothetical protein
MVIFIAVIIGDHASHELVECSRTEEGIRQRVRALGFGGSWQGSELHGGDGRLLAYYVARDPDEEG